MAVVNTPKKANIIYSNANLICRVLLITVSISNFALRGMQAASYNVLDLVSNLYPMPHTVLMDQPE